MLSHLFSICESGFIPAGLYLMTNWYKTFETGKRFSIYFAGSMAAAALGGLIAFGVYVLSLTVKDKLF
jgi:hypothetical protein